MTTPLHAWVTRQAERRPDAVAVVLDRERMTYGELEATSNRVARLLHEAGCASGDRACLLIPKSPTTIAAIIGVLKAGAIYVPLDPSSPAARLAKILDSCEPRWILAAGPVARLLEELFREERHRRSVRLGWLDSSALAATDLRAAFSAADLAAGSGAPLATEPAAPEAAHILFTSGSTGTPKGVVVRQSSVSHFVEWANAYFGATAADRNSGHAPLHFDLSTYDIFGTLAAGAQLHLVPPELNLLPNKLADFIRRSELSQWFSVPSVLNYMARFDVVLPNGFPALKRILWCGEVLPTPALVYWMKRLPGVSFTNLYGPTEATIASSYYTVPGCPADETATIPIGAACAGEELLVLSERREPVAPGEVGDLYIRGVGLSPGYWREPERTAAVFLPDPRSPAPSDRIYKTGDLARIGEDGLVYFLGRADSQIKSRGYRIELGEVEAALNAGPGLRECAVVAVPTEGFEGWLICCAFVPAPGAGTTPVTLRRELAKVLPSYMLPTRWRAFDRLPRNANGKIDRRALKEHFQSLESSGEAVKPVKLKPLDTPELIHLVAEWLARKENHQFLDFGGGRPPSPALIKVMVQRDTNVLRIFTAEDDTTPIGVVGLNNIDRHHKTALIWAVLGDKSHARRGVTTRAVSRMLTLAFRELGLASVQSWSVEDNSSGIELTKRLDFQFVGRQRQCHDIDGRPHDRLWFDLLASEHREIGWPSPGEGWGV